MKKLFFNIVLVCWVHSLQAQWIISNKVNVQASYSINAPLGRKTVVRDQYESPSLINNLQGGYSIGVGISCRWKQNIFAHCAVYNTNFEGWSYDRLERFKDAKYSLISINPQIEVTTPFREAGVLNRVSVFVRVGPAFSRHSVKFARSPYASSSSNVDLTSSTFFAPGVTFSIGTNLAISNKVITGFSYGINHYWVSSPLFDDKTATVSSFTIHFGFRLANNKGFKYAS
jgi:hypothetical protein